MVFTGRYWAVRVSGKKHATFGTLAAMLLVARVAIGLPLAAQPADGSFQQALALVQQGKAAPAIELLEKILTQSPADLKALNLLGIALVGSGRRVEANQRFAKALQIDPGFVPALKNLAASELALAGPR